MANGRPCLECGRDCPRNRWKFCSPACAVAYNAVHPYSQERARTTTLERWPELSGTLAALRHAWEERR